MSSISAIVIAKNVENLIVPTLKTLQFAQEIILVDTSSTDKTVQVSRPLVTKIIQTSAKQDFARWRNQAAQEAKGDWLLYIDSDERVPLALANEIASRLKRPRHNAYTIPRQEILLGKHLKHWPDPRVLRLIKKTALEGWKNQLHEQPQIEGSIGEIKNSLVHLTHRDITQMVQKTARWSQIEAKLLHQNDHPTIRPWRFWRILFTEFFKYAKKGLFKDGNQGHIEIIYQTFSRFITYVQLWQLQQDPSLKENYNQIDQKILKQWQNQ